MRSAIRSNLAAMIRQADTLARQLRAIDTTVASQETKPEPVTLETDPETDLLLAGYGEQIPPARRAA